MSSVHLESWVQQQYKEIGFGKGKDGPFIGKAALAQKLVSRYPMHKERILELVNVIKNQKTPRAFVPAVQPPAATSKTKATSKITAPPPRSARVPNPKASSKSLVKPQDIQCLPFIDMKKGAPSGHNSDSGFASGSEDVKNFSRRETSPPRTLPAIDSQFRSPTPKAPRQSTVIKGKAKAMETFGSMEPKTSNPKILELKKFLDGVNSLDPASPSKPEATLSTLSQQLGLLHCQSPNEESSGETSTSSLKAAVLFSGDVLAHYDDSEFPQYGLLGSLKLASSTTVLGSRLFLNTNFPFSAFVCGVQGSGKSHTTACMIENYLIPSPVLGVLQKPLSALVFNFAEYASVSSFRQCELAFLASPNSQLPSHLGVQKVNVLVSPSNFFSLKASYTQIPGVVVQPFFLSEKDLNISTMLTLMSVNETQQVPLYMMTVTKILRDMAARTAGEFDYHQFRCQLKGAGFDSKQREFLNQRLNLLESFLDLEGSNASPSFAAGEITIIDLSCPFVDASTACVLFKIAMDLYLESESTIGKVIVLDEAHKFMTETPASKELTDSLMRVIRQQRHFGVRVIISTQEPSISPKLIDLCSISIVHRFSSPEWLEVLRKHIPFSDEENSKDGKIGILREIMRLKTGEALVFAPLAIFGTRDEAGEWRNGTDELLRIRMRKRVTWDGGKSVVCV